MLDRFLRLRSRLVELTAEEGRVLGCLVEKELTTPQLYPLTENALLAACNQTTSRDPVVRYDASTVRLAVRALREKELLRTVHRPGERSEKHRHLLANALGLTPGSQALLAMLLLRGPQTAAELRARTERMHPFAAASEVEDELHAMAVRSEPLLELLPRQPGQKEPRYADLLVVTGPQPPGPQPTSEAALDDDLAVVSIAAPPDVAELTLQVGQLRAEVEGLRTELRAALAAFEA
jgi:uncharacterized protein YceH (UPF0502 family)